LSAKTAARFIIGPIRNDKGTVMNTGNDRLVIELHYLPSVAYFVYLSFFENVFIDLGEQYSKQTYRNRCIINGANKVENLIVPVKGRNHKTTIQNIEIDYRQKWLNNHLRAIQSAYGKAPFFEYYADDLFEIFKSKPARLIDLNLALLTKCLEFLELQIDIDFIEKIEKFTENNCYDAKNIIHPKKSLSKSELFTPQKYFQIFGKNFVPNLSVIDLIFCEGPAASQIIKDSTSLGAQI